jgi:hypothetical protein
MIHPVVPAFMESMTHHIRDSPRRNQRVNQPNKSLNASIL